MSFADELEKRRKQAYGKSYTPIGSSTGGATGSTDFATQLEQRRKQAYSAPPKPQPKVETKPVEVKKPAGFVAARVDDAQRLYAGAKQAVGGIIGGAGVALQNAADIKNRPDVQADIKKEQAEYLKIADEARKKGDIKKAEEWEQAALGRKERTEQTFKTLSETAKKLKDSSNKTFDDVKAYRLANLPIEDPKSFQEGIKDPAWIKNRILDSAPSMLASLGISAATLAVTKNPAATVAVGYSSTFSQNAGYAYQDARENKANEKIAQKSALTVGVWAGALDMLPIGRLLNRTTAGEVIKRNIVKEMTKSFLKQAALESSTESGQEIIANAVAKAYDANRDFFQGVPETALISGIIGGVTGGGTDAGSTLIRTSDKQAAELNEKIETIIKTPEESRTRDEKEFLAAALDKSDDVVASTVFLGEETEQDFTTDDTTTTENATSAEVIKLEQNIQDYKQSPGFTPGVKTVEEASLRDITKQVDKPEVVEYTKTKVDKAIISNEIPLNDDGTITLYRAGKPSDRDRLVSATYDKDIAQTFVDDAGAQGTEVPITQIKVQPEDIKVFIGKGEKEVLIQNPATIKQPEAQDSSVEVQVFDKEGNPVKDKKVRLFSSKEALAIQEVISNQFSRINTTAASEEELTTRSLAAIDNAIKKANGERYALSGIRTAVNKELFGAAGIGQSGDYKSDYKDLKTVMASDYPLADYLRELEGKIAEIDELLIEGYTKSTQDTQKAKAENIAEKPNAQKPVGEGRTKTSKLGLGVEEKAVEAGLVKRLKDLPQYNKVNLKDQADKAGALIKSDEQYAVDIALGRDNPPKGLLPESVFVAVENAALKAGDVELIRQLSKSSLVTEATAMGQRIRALGERDSNSPVEAIINIEAARKRILEKRSGKKAEKEVKKNVAQIQKKIKPADRYDWDSFISSIEC